MSAPDSSPRKLRVAVFNRTFSPTGGGAERYSIALVEQLSARHEVHVFAQVIDHQVAVANHSWLTQRGLRSGQDTRW